MKKILTMALMLLAFCAQGFAANSEVTEIASDYQAVLGGDRAIVELTDHKVMAAVANLKIYSKMNAVMLPKDLKNYMVVRTGKEQAFLIIPHYAKTRMTVLNAMDRKKAGSLKGDLEGRSLLLFCNKGDTMIDMLVRTVNGIQLVNFIPEAEELQENGRPGAMIIPERRQRFLKDVTAQISHDGEIVKVDGD